MIRWSDRTTQEAGILRGFVRNLQADGVSAYDHSSTRMTERYAHLSTAHKARAVKALDSAYPTDTKTDTLQEVASNESS